MRPMSKQPESEVVLLKRKLWRIGVLADALEQKLYIMRDPMLREEAIRIGMREILTEIARPPGRQKQPRRETTTP